MGTGRGGGGHNGQDDANCDQAGPDDQKGPAPIHPQLVVHGVTPEAGGPHGGEAKERTQDQSERSENKGKWIPPARVGKDQGGHEQDDSDDPRGLAAINGMRADEVLVEVHGAILSSWPCGPSAAQRALTRSGSIRVPSAELKLLACKAHEVNLLLSWSDRGPAASGQWRRPIRDE